MTRPDVGDALLVSQSPRGQLPTVGIIAAFLCMYVLAGASDVIPGWLMWTGVATFGGALVMGLYVLVKARNSSWEFRLDREGVTVRGHETRPWSDVAEVRVTGLRPRWFFIWSLGYRVVAFVAQPGREMPALPSTKLWARVAAHGVRQRERWYGAQLLLMPHAYDASTQDIVDAVRRFSDVPVRGSGGSFVEEP